jgi:PAS domain S-box-containing protein
VPIYSQIYQHPEIIRYKEKLINSSLIVGSLLGIGLYFSAIFGGDLITPESRAFNFLFVFIMLSMAIFRRKINIKTKTLSVLVLIILICIKDLIRLGLFADTLFFLALVPFFASVVFRLRTVSFISAMALVVIVLIVGLQLNGTISTSSLQPVESISEWIEKGLIIIIVGIVVLLSTVYVERRGLRLVQGILEEKKTSSERESNLSSIIESTNNIVGLFDKNKILIEYNQAFASYAFQTDGIILEKGMDLLNKINRPQAALFRVYQDRALAGEKFTETVEYPMPHGNIYFMLSYNPIYNDKEITGLSMFVQDITELKTIQQSLEDANQDLENKISQRTFELEKKNKELAVKNEILDNAMHELQQRQNQLIQSEKMASIGIMAAGLGHEINNPLNYISNGVNEIRNAALGSRDRAFLEFSKPLFEIVSQGVDRASKIVASLSQYGRNTENNEAECNIQNIIDNCLTIIQISNGGQISILRDPGDQLLIPGNSGRLHQLFTNILNNALDARVNGGEIRISEKRVDGKAQITIIDNGVGISNENLSKIADPFFTTKSPGQGIGLGLYIAYQIVEEHRGKILIENASPKGTKVTITLHAGT